MASERAKAARPLRVLVVEDDVDFAESLVDLLEPEGFEVRTATNIADAITQLAEFSAQIALIDIRLGTENGVELVPKLKRRRPALVCLLMTAYAAIDTAVEAVKNSADDYLLKPLEPTRLMARLRTAATEAEALEQKKREQRLSMMGQLCGAVAHDMNNYLQAVLLDVEDAQMSLREQHPNVEEASRKLDSVMGSVDSTAEVCRRLLSFARGNQSGDRAEATAIAKHCGSMLQRLVGPSVTLNVKVSPEALWVGCDATTLQQVIMNLVLNAAQAIEDHGSVKVRVCPETLGNVPGVQLEIADDGCGIPEESLPQIFEPYFSTKPADQGTGLGLSIVHGVVTSVGGTVDVTSQRGQGTTFHIWLPQVEPGQSHERIKRPSSIPPRATRLLIVDDFQPLLDSLRRAFERAGYETICVSNAEEAMTALTQPDANISALITDIELPGMSGLELMQNVKRVTPQLPVALMSGKTAVRSDTHAGSPAPVFHKVFKVDTLLDWIGANLGLGGAQDVPANVQDGPSRQE